MRAMRQKGLATYLFFWTAVFWQTIRLLRYRACLTTIYSCGLRLKEGTHLQVADIDKSEGSVRLRLD